MGPRACLDVVEKKSVCPCREWSPGFVSNYSLYRAIPDNAFVTEKTDVD
jgi:hypothetical protein